MSEEKSAVFLLSAEGDPKSTQVLLPRKSIKKYFYHVQNVKIVIKSRMELMFKNY